MHRVIAIHARPRQTHRRTDEHHGNSARRFVLMNASRAKNYVKVKV